MSIHLGLDLGVGLDVARGRGGRVELRLLLVERDLRGALRGRLVDHLVAVVVVVVVDVDVDVVAVAVAVAVGSGEGDGDGSGDGDGDGSGSGSGSSTALTTYSQVASVSWPTRSVAT
jgi:hypothetical protein